MIRGGGQQTVFCGLEVAAVAALPHNDTREVVCLTQRSQGAQRKTWQGCGRYGHDGRTVGNAL